MRYLFVLLVIALPASATAQYHWSPLSLPNAEDRYNDVWFVDPLVGWAIIPSDGFKEDGFIYKTTDGGSTWETQYKSYKHLRSVCFLDPLVGFVGFLWGGTESPLLRTTDGGITWNTADITGSMPSGICGMMRVDDSTVVASGQVYGPAHFLRTTDRGESWQSVALTDREADWAIDCYFWSRDSGIVVGGSMGSMGSLLSHIWQTTDGGRHWTDKYIGPEQNPQEGEWCWKISFPSSDVGYISLEQNRGAARYLKTTDRGRTWRRHEIPNATIHLQGCGFISELQGWMGGRGNGAYVTDDGGATWNSTPDLKFINRLRFFGDSLGYAAGQQIYKLTKEKSYIAEQPSMGSAMTYDRRRSEITLADDANAGSVSITDLSGRQITTIRYYAGMRRVDLSSLPEGIYFAHRENGEILKFIR
jgi:photosystem II stability/assembly factor-like uncharacterized protein